MMIPYMSNVNSTPEEREQEYANLIAFLKERGYNNTPYANLHNIFPYAQEQKYVGIYQEQNSPYQYPLIDNLTRDLEYSKDNTSQTIASELNNLVITQTNVTSNPASLRVLKSNTPTKKERAKKLVDESKTLDKELLIKVIDELSYTPTPTSNSSSLIPAFARADRIASTHFALGGLLGRTREEGLTAPYSAKLNYSNTAQVIGNNFISYKSKANNNFGNALTDNTKWERGIINNELLPQRFNIWNVSSSGLTITLTSIAPFNNYKLTNSQVVNGTTIGWIADANAPGYLAGQHYTLTIDGNSYNLFANTTGQEGREKQWQANEGVEAVYSESLNGFVIKSGAGGSGYRQLGEIVQSVIPLTDAGLVLAQGGLFSSNGSYKAFYSYLSELAYQEMQTIPASSLNLNFNSVAWDVHGGFDNTIQAGSNYVYINSSSGSAQGDYFYCRDTINAINANWEFTFAFAITDTPTEAQGICGFAPSGTGNMRLAVFVNTDRTLRLSASSSGASSYDIFNENTNLQLSPNVVYRIKISYSSSTGYKAYLGEAFHGFYVGNFQNSPFWTKAITTNVLNEDTTLQCGRFGLSANDIVKYCIGTKIVCDMWGLDYNNSNHLAPIASSKYNGELFASNSVYNSYVSSTGGCSKYIISPRSFRLPFLNGWLKCGASNKTLEAGLPNISDSFTTTDSITGDVMWPGGDSAYSSFASGAFSLSTSSGPGNGHSSSIPTGVNTITLSHSYSFSHSFQASDSSSIYGNASTVQPKGAQVYTYICCATTTKTDYEIDIDEVMADISTLGNTLGGQITDLQGRTSTWTASTSGTTITLTPPSGFTADSAIRTNGFTISFIADVDAPATTHPATYTLSINGTNYNLWTNWINLSNPAGLWRANQRVEIYFNSHENSFRLLNIEWMQPLYNRYADTLAWVISSGVSADYYYRWQQWSNGFTIVYGYYPNDITCSSDVTTFNWTLPIALSSIVGATAMIMPAGNGYVVCTHAHINTVTNCEIKFYTLSGERIARFRYIYMGIQNTKIS